MLVDTTFGHATLIISDAFIAKLHPVGPGCSEAQIFCEESLGSQFRKKEAKETGSISLI